ncbi:hypothetical protein ACKI1J_42130 [Streptomyces scabiei]|uniref:hypothetical protein n=1 Tax=Streptomyces scabiei TaxID=1930 RepID=UPI0038F78EDA
MAEQEWQEWAIARRRGGVVLAPDGGSTDAGTEVAEDPQDTDAQQASRVVAKPRSQVPVISW